MITTHAAWRLDLVYTTTKGFENGGFTLKTHRVSSSTLRRGDLKTPQLPVNLDLFLRRTRSRKPHDYRGAIVFQQCRFHIVFRPLENKKLLLSNPSAGLEERLRKVPFL